MYIYINVILNKTVTKLFTILTKCFFPSYLNRKNHSQCGKIHATQKNA